MQAGLDSTHNDSISIWLTKYDRDKSCRLNCCFAETWIAVTLWICHRWVQTIARHYYGITALWWYQPWIMETPFKTSRIISRNFIIVTNQLLIVFQLILKMFFLFYTRDYVLETFQDHVVIGLNALKFPLYYLNDSKLKIKLTLEISLNHPFTFRDESLNWLFRAYNVVCVMFAIFSHPNQTPDEYLWMQMFSI